MNTLVSLVNSGESFDKALVLAVTSLRAAPQFYSSFDKIIIYYSENLPKTASAQYGHGSLGALTRYWPNSPLTQYSALDDLWEDRTALLAGLISAGRLSPRTADRYRNDRELYLRTVPHCPWILFYPEMQNVPITAGGLVSVEFRQVDFRLHFYSIYTSMPYSATGLAKLYQLHPDGAVSCRSVSPPMRGRVLEGIRRGLTSSVGWSTNVFLLIQGIRWAASRGSDLAALPTMGYRCIEMTAARASYDSAVRSLVAGRLPTSVEPENEGFGRALGRIDARMPDARGDHRINLAIYDELSRLV